MDFEEFQSRTRETAIYEGRGEYLGLVYTSLGLAGEAGEVAENVKKTWRDDLSVITEERREAIIKELGDVLWYAAQIASELGVSFRYVAEKNVEKLHGRKRKGTIRGRGSNR